MQEQVAFRNGCFEGRDRMDSGAVSRWAYGVFIKRDGRRLLARVRMVMCPLRGGRDGMVSGRVVPADSRTAAIVSGHDVEREVTGAGDVARGGPGADRAGDRDR
jgi:hypothetical protein